MIPFLKRFWQPSKLSREELLCAYSTHLALIDSRKIPQSFEHGPDLACLIETAEYYHDLICQSVVDVADLERQSDPQLRARAILAHHRMVMATWGLIARGADAMVQANALMDHEAAQVRVCGEHFFLGIRHAGRVPEVYHEVCDQLQIDVAGEYPLLQATPKVLGLISALGWLRARQSVPLLIHYIIAQDTDDRLRQTAAISLGRVVHKRFDRLPEKAIDLAGQWIAQHMAVATEPAATESTLS